MLGFACKKFVILTFMLFAGAMPVFALNLDMSVDDEIRKNYNPSKLELEALPSIPETENIPQTTTLPSLPQTVSQPVTIPPVQTKTYPVQPPKTTPVIQYSQNTGNVKKGLPNTSGKNDLAAVKISHQNHLL